jgi:CDP-diglyceride synthetase
MSGGETPERRRPSLEPGFLFGEEDADFDETPPEFLALPKRERGRAASEAGAGAQEAAGSGLAESTAQGQGEAGPAPIPHQSFGGEGAPSAGRAAQVGGQADAPHQRDDDVGTEEQWVAFTIPDQASDDSTATPPLPGSPQAAAPGRRRLFGHRRDRTPPAPPPEPDRAPTDSHEVPPAPPPEPDRAPTDSHEVRPPEPAGTDLFDERPLSPALQLRPDPALVPPEAPSPPPLTPDSTLVPPAAHPPPATPPTSPVPPTSAAETSGEVPEARWRSDVADYSDEGWESITAEFRALQAKEAEESGQEPPLVVGPAESEISTEEDEGEEEGGTPPPRRGERNVGVALVTGLVLGFVALGLIRAGRPWFFGLELVLLVLALVELYTGLQQGKFRPATAPGLLGAVVILLATYRQGVEALGFGLAMVLVFTLLWFLLGVIRSHPVANLGVTVLGVLYVAFLGSYAVQILGFPDWQGITIAYLAMTIASDVGAYVVGSRTGRLRIFPSVSPHKSVEGILGGGILAAAVAAIAIRKIHPFTVKTALLLAVVVMIAAPLGDLLESMLKRAVGVKDLGTLLPGHGGVLDRIDSILIVAPAVFYFSRLVLY